MRELTRTTQGWRRSLVLLGGGLMDYAWVGWVLLCFRWVVRGSADILVLGAALAVSMHEFAALRRRKLLVEAQLSSSRWLRRMDDAYFDAVHRFMSGLAPELRERFGAETGARPPRDVAEDLERDRRC